MNKKSKELWEDIDKEKSKDNKDETRVNKNKIYFIVVALLILSALFYLFKDKIFAEDEISTDKGVHIGRLASIVRN